MPAFFIFHADRRDGSKKLLWILCSAVMNLWNWTVFEFTAVFVEDGRSFPLNNASRALSNICAAITRCELNICFNRLQISEVMEKKTSYLYLRTRVHTIIDILKNTTHNAFPVVSNYRNSNQDSGSTTLVGVSITHSKDLSGFVDVFLVKSCETCGARWKQLPIKRARGWLATAEGEMQKCHFEMLVHDFLGPWKLSIIFLLQLEYFYQI